MNIPERQLGPWQVSAMGLGCMPMSGMPVERAAILEERDAAIGVIHTALDAGITLLDTADIYAPSWKTFGHNERLVGEAFRTWSASAEAKSKVVIATKNGITRGPNESWGRAATKDYFLRAAEASALRLGVEKIQLWQHHRLDPEVPFEVQFENLLVLLDRGLVERIGVSNYSAEQLRRAVKLGGRPDEGGVISIQNQYSPRYRNDSDVFRVCEEFGIAFLPWSPLGGVRKSSELGEGSFGPFGEVGESKGVSAYATAIAWLLHTSPTVIPIPGATRASSLLDSLEGVSISITESEIEFLNLRLPEDSPLDHELVDQPVFLT